MEGDKLKRCDTMTVDEVLTAVDNMRRNRLDAQTERVLAGEVRRLREAIELREKVARCLREERDLFRAASEAAELKIAELKAQVARAEVELEKPLMKELKALRRALARVNALPARWRNDAGRSNDPRSPTHLVDCADDVEEALRDDSQQAVGGDDK